MICRSKTTVSNNGSNTVPALYLYLIINVLDALHRQIDDAVTYQFMDEFYSTLFAQNDMLKAYQSALKKIMDEYTEPYYWAGFILIYN